ncbi:type VII secretion target [Kitasatospora sp. NPDC085879]|uniref:type VII secretion target n=1 Tax=Kitasatospora sp. NPDC085879 TaxID=3154769 RepID=UPI00343850F3
MSDYTAVDPERLERLAEEFREAGRNLSACIDKYTQTCSDPHDGYGTLPAGVQAAEQYSLSTADLTALLRDLRTRYDQYADGLQDSAALYRAAEAGNRAAVADLARRL